MIVETFIPDNHSGNYNKTLAASSEHKDMINYVAKNQYGLKLMPFSKLELVSGYNVNSLNFRLDNFFLKILTETQFSPRFHLFPKLVEEMKAQGIPGVKFIKNIFGEYISKFSFEGKIYYATLQPFLEGSFFTGSKASFENVIEIIKKMDIAF